MSKHPPLIIDPYWGVVHFIFYLPDNDKAGATILNELTRDENPLRLFDRNNNFTPTLPNVVIDVITTQEDLNSFIEQISTSTNCTLHFITHGKPDRPGELYLDEKHHFNFKEIFGRLPNKDALKMNLMSVCFQSDFAETGYGHLITSGENGHQLGPSSVEKALTEVYAVPFEQIDRTKLERIKLYKVHY